MQYDHEFKLRLNTHSSHTHSQDRADAMLSSKVKFVQF